MLSCCCCCNNNSSNPPWSIVVARHLMQAIQGRRRAAGRKATAAIHAGCRCPNTTDHLCLPQSPYVRSVCLHTERPAAAPTEDDPTDGRSGRDRWHHPRRGQPASQCHDAMLVVDVIYGMGWQIRWEEGRGGEVSIIWAAGEASHPGSSWHQLFACLCGLAGPNAPVAGLGLEVVRLGCGGDAGRPTARTGTSSQPLRLPALRPRPRPALRISIRRPFEDGAPARHWIRIPRPSSLLLLLLLLLVLFLTRAFFSLWTYSLPSSSLSCCIVCSKLNSTRSTHQTNHSNQPPVFWASRRDPLHHLEPSALPAGGIRRDLT